MALSEIIIFFKYTGNFFKLVMEKSVCFIYLFFVTWQLFNFFLDQKTGIEGNSKRKF